MRGTPRAKIGGDLKIEKVKGKAEIGDARLVEDGDKLVGVITLTERGWGAARFPGADAVMWKPRRSKPAVVRYERVMKAWSARSIWGEPDEDKGQSWGRSDE